MCPPGNRTVCPGHRTVLLYTTTADQCSHDPFVVGPLLVILSGTTRRPSPRRRSFERGQSVDQGPLSWVRGSSPHPRVSGQSRDGGHMGRGWVVLCLSGGRGRRGQYRGRRREESLHRLRTDRTRCGVPTTTTGSLGLAFPIFWSKR